MATRNTKNSSIIDDVINQVTRLTKAGRETAADLVENVSPDAASFIRPESKPRSAKTSTKRTIKVTGPKSTSAKTAVAGKSQVKKGATVRKASSRSAHKSATR